MEKVTKAMSIFIVAVIYIVAFIAGVITLKLVLETTQRLLPAFFAADIAATVIVWLFGLIYRNSSIYDPYWSIAPIVLVVAFVLLIAPVTGQLNFASILYIGIISLWGMRLTLNWAVGWPDLRHQDWRYTKLKQDNPKKIWHIANFFGIHLMPTLIVFAGMLPVYFTTFSENPVNFVTFIGAAICIYGILLELVSDLQMRRFRKDINNRGKNMQTRTVEVLPTPQLSWRSHLLVGYLGHSNQRFAKNLVDSVRAFIDDSAVHFYQRPDDRKAAAGYQRRICRIPAKDIDAKAVPAKKIGHDQKRKAMAPVFYGHHGLFFIVCVYFIPPV